MPNLYTYNGRVVRVGGGIARNSGGGSSDPYPLYTAFDRNDIDWHVGAGDWGAQLTFQAAEPPNITGGEFTAGSASDVNTLSATSGRRIIIDSNMGDITVGGTGLSRTDIDIVLNAGVRVGSITLSGNITRVRVRGPTVGSYSGGSMAGFFTGFGSVTQQDIIVDGVGISGNAQPIIQPHFGVDRMAFLNCRIRSGYQMSFCQDVRHMFWANCSGIVGAAGYSSGPVWWGIRHDGDGPLVVVDCDFRTPFSPGDNAYHRIRSSPPTGTTDEKHVFIQDTTAVDSGQSTFFWCNLIDTNNGTDRHASMIVRRARTYSGGAGGNGTIYPESVSNYAEVSGGTYYGRPSSSDLASSESGSNASVKVFTNNTFNSYSADPAWGAAGDPTGLPLT